MSKKILYVCKYPLEIDVSLKNKFRGQIEGFKQLGLDCYYLAFDDKSYYLINGDNKKKLKTIKNGNSSRYLHLAAFIDLYKCAIKAMKDIDFDYLYVRADPIELSGVQMYKYAQKRGAKLICEIPTYPIYRDNIKSRAMKIALAVSDSLHQFVSRYVDLYAIIGDKCESFRSRPTINIDNGVSPELFSLKNPIADDNINIIGVASMSNWQGYDRAIKGLAEYKGDKQIKLRLVGNDGDGSLAEWKQLAKSLNVLDKVEFIPARYGVELDELIDKSDVGLATLALYRSRLKHASPLKVREYMSRGLPIVYSSNDSSLNGEYDFTLRVAENESALDIEEIAEFAKRVKNNKSISESMRKFAIENMSWKSELSKIFNKLENR